MSLDVTLYGEEIEKECVCPRCDNVHIERTREVLFEANITHNLGPMAAEAGIYDALWRPEEVGIHKARQLIKPLTNGLAFMKESPKKCKRHNPSNGWGSYEVFVPWVERYLEACQRFPDAKVSAER
jgi:hypothetical protein